MRHRDTRQELEGLTKQVDDSKVLLLKQIKQLQNDYRSIIDLSRVMKLEDIRRNASGNLRNLGVCLQAIRRFFSIEIPPEEKKPAHPEVFQIEEDEDDDILGLSLFDDVE